MWHHWGEFFLLLGSAAAVLIGLIFVVISLMQDRSRSSVLMGSKLYMGPIVLGVSFVLVLSAAALTPRMEHEGFALVTAVIALWGLARGILSILGLRRLRRVENIHWTDPWFYGVMPSALYVALGVVAAGLWSHAEWARYGLAAVLNGLLLLAIRNEWDLITWIAPRGEGGLAQASEDRASGEGLEKPADPPVPPERQRRPSVQTYGGRSCSSPR